MARALLSLLIITTLNMVHAKAQIDSAAFFWAGLTQQGTNNSIVINDRSFMLEKIQSVTLKNHQIVSFKNIQEGHATRTYLPSHLSCIMHFANEIK